MGQVMIVFRLMPTTAEVDMAAVAKKVPAVIPTGAQLRGTTLVPVAFGLKALHVTVIVADEEGWTDRLEETLRSVPDVESVEVQELSLV